MSDENYSLKQMIYMEANILKNLNYEVLTASPYQFLSIISQELKGTERIQESILLAQYILELSLLEYKSLKFNASVKACAAIYISRKMLNFDNPWSSEIKQVFSLRDGLVKDCAKQFTELMIFANKTALKSCKTKYSSKEFLKVHKFIEKFK